MVVEIKTAPDGTQYAGESPFANITAILDAATEALFRFHWGFVNAFRKAFNEPPVAFEEYMAAVRALVEDGNAKVTDMLRASDAGDLTHMAHVYGFTDARVIWDKPTETFLWVGGFVVEEFPPMGADIETAKRWIRQKEQE